MTDQDLSYIHPDLRPLAVAIKELTPDPKNARRHDKRNLDTIKASLARFGMRQAIVAQRKGDELVVRAGNGRLRVATELGWSHLPVLVFEANEDEAVAYAIEDNRTAELAEWDFAMLTDVLAELEGAGVNVEELGWSDNDREALDAMLREGAADPTGADPSTRTGGTDAPAPSAYTIRIVNVPPALKEQVVSAINAALEPVAGVTTQAIAY